MPLNKETKPNQTKPAKIELLVLHINIWNHLTVCKQNLVWNI